MTTETLGHLDTLCHQPGRKFQSCLLQIDHLFQTLLCTISRSEPGPQAMVPHHQQKSGICPKSMCLAVPVLYFFFFFLVLNSRDTFNIAEAQRLVFYYEVAQGRHGELW